MQFWWSSTSHSLPSAVWRNCSGKWMELSLKNTQTFIISFPQSRNQLQPRLHSYRGGSDAITSSCWKLVCWSSGCVYAEYVSVLVCICLSMTFEWNPLLYIDFFLFINREEHIWMVTLLLYSCFYLFSLLSTHMHCFSI